MNNLWTALEVEDDFSLPSKEFNELVVELLEEAGGVSQYGSLIMESGGRCESGVSIMYDEYPKKLCDLAANLRERFSCCGNSSRESGTTPACPARLAGVG